jgi:hypothetical protein
VNEKGEAGNNFSIIVGGGNREPGSTVMILEKNDDRLTVEVINAAGERLLHRELTNLPATTIKFPDEMFIFSQNDDNPNI